MQRCAVWACWASAWEALARQAARKLVTDEVLHPIGLKPAPPNVPTAQFGQLVGYKCVASRDIGASKTLLSCCFASPLQHNGGGAQAFRLGPLPMSYQCDAIASLAALAAADALAGAGRALSTS